VDGHLGEEALPGSLPRSVHRLHRSGLCPERCGRLFRHGDHAVVDVPGELREAARQDLAQPLDIAHLGTRAFGAIAGEVVSTTVTVFANVKSEVKGAYFRLVDMGSEAEKQAGLLEALADPDCGWFYRADADGFGAIPGSPIAYWASLATRKAYAKMPTVEDVARPHIGIQTGDNERFLRLWWEIALGRMYLDCPDARASQCSDKKWYPCNKGGDFRRWYGNQEYVVDWQNDGRIIVGDAEKDGRRFMNLPDNYKFCESVAWSMLSSSRAAFRFFPQGFIFEHAASAMIGSRSQLLQVLAFCNSEISRHLLSLVSPTLNFNVNCIAQLPMTISSSDHVERLSRENVYETKTDWNSFECSWDFKRHPLV